MQLNILSYHASPVGTLVGQRPIKNYGASPTPAYFYKEVGADFADGDVPNGKILEWRKGDGTVLPSQADNFVRWPSGCVRRVSASLRYNGVMNPSASDTLKEYVVDGTWNNTSWATTSVISAKGIRFDVTLATPLTQVIGTGDGVQATFSGTVAGAPIRPGLVVVTYKVNTSTQTYSDNGAGGWMPWAGILSGSINYTTGAITITFANAFRPTTGNSVTIQYVRTIDAGTTYSLLATNEVARGTNITQRRSGPVNAMWRLFGELRLGTGSSSPPEGDIWAILYLTFFPDGTYTAWAQIENGRFTKATVAAKFMIGYTLSDNSGTLFASTAGAKIFGGAPIVAANSDGLHPYTGTSVDKVVVGNPTLTLGDPTTRGLYDSFDAWWQVSTPTMIAALHTTTTATYFPNSRGDSPFDINGTGLHVYVGLITGWSATAWMAKDWNSLRTDRVNAFTYLVAQGSFQDATPGVGYPGNLTLNKVYPGLGVANRTVCWSQASGGTIAFTGGATSVGTPLDGSHAGIWAWYQYVATGQEQWLDMLQNQCIGQLGWPPNQPGLPTGRNPVINGLPFYANYPAGGQVRAGGWNLRNVGHTYWMTPDNHPMKPYLSDIELATYDVFAEYVRPPNSPATMATMGIYFTQGSNFIAGWMDDYLFTSFCTAVRRGRIPANHHFITFHHIPWTLGRHLSPSCPWGSYSYHYSVGVGPNPTIPSQTPPFTGDVFAQTWDDVWWGEAEDPYPFQLIKGPGNGACPVSGLYAVSNSNFAVGGSSYPNQGRVAVTLAKQVGLPTAATAYTYIENEMVLTNISETRWADLGGCAWRIDIPQ